MTKLKMGCDGGINVFCKPVGIAIKNAISTELWNLTEDEMELLTTKILSAIENWCICHQFDGPVPSKYVQDDEDEFPDYEWALEYAGNFWWYTEYGTFFDSYPDFVDDESEVKSMYLDFGKDFFPTQESFNSLIRDCIPLSRYIQTWT